MSSLIAAIGASARTGSMSKSSVHADDADDAAVSKEGSGRGKKSRRFSSRSLSPKSSRRMSTQNFSRSDSIRNFVSPKDEKRKSVQQSRIEEIKGTVKLSFNRGTEYKEDRVGTEHKKRSFFSVDPANMRMWDLLLFMLQLWTVFTAPLDLFFEEQYCQGIRDNSKLYALVCVVEVLYMLDILRCFFTIDVSGTQFHGLEYEENTKKNALNYFKGRFIFDAVGSLPVIALTMECRRGPLSTTLSFLKLLRLARMPAMLYRYTQIHSYKLAKRLEDRNSFQVLKQVLLLLLFAHFIACAFYSLGRANGDNGWIPEFTKQCNNTIVPSDDSIPVVCTESSWEKQYVYALYWTMATLATVGYGDISPIADNEMVFSILVMLFGAVLYASVFGVVTVTLQNLNEDRNRYQEKTAVVRSFIFNYRKELPQDLQDRIMSYTDFMWSIDKGFDLESVASGFPLDMHEQIKMSILSGFVYNVNFFEGLAEDFIRGVCMGLQSNACLAQDYIYREGHYGLHMIFIRKGEVNLLVNVAGVMTIIDRVEEGGYFGEISWFLKIKRTETAMADRNCEYYTLDYPTFEKASEKHPEYKDLIRLKVKQKLAQDVTDWEDAEMGFSDLYTAEKKDNLTEKLKISKQMLQMCDMISDKVPLTVMEDGYETRRRRSSYRVRKPSAPQTPLPEGMIPQLHPDLLPSHDKGGDKGTLADYIKMAEENRELLQKNNAMLQAISKHLGLPSVENTVQPLNGPAINGVNDVVGCKKTEGT